MAYLLDTNVLIAAKNLYYGFDFCPAFWDWLIRKHQTSKVFSVEQVFNEIAGGDDDLVEWARSRADGFFRPIDEATLPSLKTVAQWVEEAEAYTPAAKNTFLQVADYYLIAQAHAGGHTVVTQERPENSRNRVKIPNVCLGIGVRYMNTFDMLRQERARFVIGP